MKILSIGNDKNLFNPDSLALSRQKEYYKSLETDLIVLTKGEKHDFISNDIHAWRAGGNNKMIVFFTSLILGVRLAANKKYSLILAQDVEFSGFIAFIIAKIFNIPLITQLHGNYLDNPLWIKQRKINHAINIAGRFILKRSSAVRVVSQRIRRETIANYKINEDIIKSLPIGSDLSMFMPDANIKREPVILFVGRLIEEKSPLLFCRVASRILHDRPEAKAVIMGEGNLHGEMDKFFKDLDLQDRVVFTGFIPPAECSRWYRRAYCLLHTAAWEGWGMPMIEAMACGCPVVSTDTGCAGEAVLDDVSGYVTAIDDEEALYQASLKIFSDRNILDKLSQGAVRESAKWSFSALAREINKFYSYYAKKNL